ncbi:MAG: hypothetical protein ACK5XN_18295, partial [Bacteroidota bacterium]
MQLRELLSGFVALRPRPHLSRLAILGQALRLISRSSSFAVPPIDVLFRAVSAPLRSQRAHPNAAFFSLLFQIFLVPQRATLAFFRVSAWPADALSPGQFHICAAFFAFQRRLELESEGPLKLFHLGI